MLDIKRLYHSHDLYESIIKDSYEEVFKQCCKIIQMVSDAGHLECWYVIPNMVLGKPPINTGECGEYIRYRLRNYPFKILYFEPNIMYINWEKEGKYPHSLQNRFENDELLRQEIENSNKTNTPMITQFVVILIIIFLGYMYLKYL